MAVGGTSEAGAAARAEAPTPLPGAPAGRRGPGRPNGARLTGRRPPRGPAPLRTSAGVAVRGRAGAGLLATRKQGRV